MKPLFNCTLEKFMSLERQALSNQREDNKE